MAIHGIDVSKWQGNIDFKKVKAAGVDFVIINAGYGRSAGQRDPYFEQNYQRAKAAGLNVGAYWYSYATSVADAKTEAAACLSVIKGKTFEYPIYFDLEEHSQFRKGTAFCSSLVTAFCGELEKKGYFAGLYISRSPLTQYITSEVRKRYALWIAEYGAKLNYSGDYGMWQNSSSWRVPGIAGNVDHDYSYIDYPKIIKAAGLNGFKKSDEKKPSDGSDNSDESNKKSDEKKPSNKGSVITYTVKKGDTLWAIAQKYKTTVEKIVKDNKIANPDLIYAGQKLKIKT